MSDISFQQIMTLARQESARLHHYFVGVEHLFIALTQVNGGLASAVLAHHALSARFTRYNIRETVGRYEDRRFWPGFPETPRAAAVLQVAHGYASAGKRPELALLLAILDEGDSVVVRVIREMGAEPEALRDTAEDWTEPLSPEMPTVPIVGTVALEPERGRVLQAMFRDYAEVEVLRQLDGGYSPAQVLLVRAKRIGGGSDSPVVVKLDDRYAILHERRRYDLHVHRRLPVEAARQIDPPVVPDNSHYGGLKYTFVGDLDTNSPINLREIALQRDTHAVNRLIRALYMVFGPAWWGQRQPYQFGVWREYEHVLPPALVVDVLPERDAGATGHVLLPLGNWSRNNHVMPGEIVALNRLTVQKLDVDADILYLAAGAQPEAINRSGKVEVRGLHLSRDSYARGDVIENLVARVVSTRDDLLLRYLQALDPPFDFRADMIPSGHDAIPDLRNPLRGITRLLERQINGSLSTVHGDMHLANVLVGPHGNPWLIDFALAREGHTLFDWALLEISLLVHVVATLAPAGWDGMWGVLALIQSINRGEDRVLRERHPVARALTAVKAIREIVRECLHEPGRWVEYYIPLALIGLRAMGWRTESADSRRLAFLSAALALSAVHSPGDVATSDGQGWSDSDRTDVGFRPVRGDVDGFGSPPTHEKHHKPPRPFDPWDDDSWLP